MKVAVDRHIPFVRAQIEAYNTARLAVGADNLIDAEYIEPEEFTSERVRDKDALIIRTRTRIDSRLLDRSRVCFVATATIGYDHIDTDYCRRQGIFWTACPGCNSQAVCDYIKEALSLIRKRVLLPQKPVLGIVGVGHVGGKVASMAAANGFEVLLNDPVRAEKEPNLFVPLDTIVENSDIITFHTPLTKDGKYPTCHLCNAAFLSRCKSQAVLINAARGGVIDEQALLASGRRCIIDCWEGEPDINRRLLSGSQTLGATCHIAGYSIEGKRNASRMCLEELARFFRLPKIWNETIAETEEAFTPQGDSAEGWIERLTEQMRTPQSDFEKIRKAYKLR